MRINFKFLLKIDFWLIMLTLLVSIIADYYFFSNNLNLSNFDAVSRLNIARKITDNLTPGLGQFGSVWPFLPQLIMAPFLVFTPLWHSGIAGAIMSSSSFIISAYLIYLILLDITKSKFASFFGSLLFISNVNILLLQSMAMSEPIFIALCLGGTYGLLRWVKSPTTSLISLATAGACLAGASLVRYEGIAFVLLAIGVVFITTWLKKYSLKIAEGLSVLFGAIAIFGLFLWCLYNLTIFNDPFYWAKIYSGQSSIISSDVRQKSTYTDQSRKTSFIKPTFGYNMAQYTLSIAELSGLPVFVLGVFALIIYIPLSKPWKKPEAYIILLPISIVGFMTFNFLKGGVPMVVPWLDLKSLNDFKTNLGFEYNIRYGILLWPLIVILIAWLFSKKNILKPLLILILCISIVTPFVHKYFLQYQLPIKWATGSATSHAEDQATMWMKANYTGGLIMISALKHDPVMFNLGLPYKTYIHEGAGKYWLTSREHPEKYAQWIFMNDPQNPLGGTAGEEDSVTKYLQYDATLNQYYIQRYNDGIISIYEKRTGSKESATSLHPNWAVKSVDTMKISRDKAGEWLQTGQPTAPEIYTQIQQIKTMQANFIAIDTPYDEKFYPYLKLWADTAHAQGLRVWFRGNWSAWEGWFNMPKGMTRVEHIQKTYAFIKDHADLFKDGDSFTSCPECENGGPGDPRTTGDKIGYNQFLIDENTITKRAFNEIGKQVTTNWFSMNGDIAKDVLTPDTINQLDGILTIDHYVSPTQMEKDITFFVQKFNAKILIGEYGVDGYNTQGNNIDTTQASRLNDMLNVFAGEGDRILGVNYWTNVVGPTGLLDENTYQPKPVAGILSNYYANPTFTGIVLDANSKPLTDVFISNGSIKQDVSLENGSFIIPITPRTYIFTFRKAGYQTSRLTVDFSKATAENYRIILEKTIKRTDYIQTIVAYIRNILKNLQYTFTKFIHHER